MSSTSVETRKERRIAATKGYTVTLNKVDIYIFVEKVVFGTVAFFSEEQS